MNKVIKELYRRAHTTRHYDGDPSLDGNPPTVYWQDEVSANRFAELIIKECAEAIKNSVWHLPRGYKAADQAEFVKKHFGVNP